MKLLKISNFCFPAFTLGKKLMKARQGCTKYCSASTVASKMLCTHRTAHLTDNLDPIGPSACKLNCYIL